MKHLRIVSLLAALTVAAVLAGSARAVSTPSTYDFFNCHGPAGTPSAFTAVKEAVPAGHGVSAAAAFHITDGSGIFIVLSFGGEGFFSPPGITVSGVATTSCDVNTTSGTLTFSGFIARP